MFTMLWCEVLKTNSGFSQRAFFLSRQLSSLSLCFTFPQPSMESGADSWVNWSKFTGLHGNHTSMPASALTKYNKNLENTLYIYIQYIMV